jgi:hypothetical protein
MASFHAATAVFEYGPKHATYTLIWNPLRPRAFARPSYDLSLSSRVERKGADRPFVGSDFLGEAKAVDQGSDQRPIELIHPLPKSGELLGVNTGSNRRG